MTIKVPWAALLLLKLEVKDIVIGISETAPPPPPNSRQL